MRLYLVLAVLLVAFFALKDASAPASAQQEDRIRVFLELPGRPQQADLNVIAGLGGQMRHQFATSNTISIEIPAVALPALERSGRFFNVRIVPEVVALQDSLDWGVTRIAAERVWGGQTGALDVLSGAPAGQGVKVAVIDTGIQRGHPDLAPNIAGGRNWVQTCWWLWCRVDNANYEDDHGHGTHVAGTIAAADNAAGLVGVAPRASLYAYKVLNANGSGRLDDVIAAIEYAGGLNGGVRADIINLSLGCYCDDPALKAAVDKVYAAGVLIVAAAGNCGTGGGSGCPPAGSTDTVIYPAKYDSVMAVAATCGGANSQCSGLDARAAFSSVGPAVEVAAPGALIRSTYLNDSYATLSGTSMASPHVAGVAALLKSAQPGLSASGLRQRLQSTAQDLGPPGQDTSFGFGIIDAAAATGASVATPDTTPPSVVGVTPAAGATGVTPSVTVSATFNEALDPASINGSFSLREADGASVSGSLSYDPAALRLNFAPSAPLRGGTTYTAHLSTAIKDLAGNNLAAEFSWSFTTVEVCTAPEISSSSDTNPSGGGTVSITWAPVAGATQYSVWRLGFWRAVTLSTTTYTAADASWDATYHIWVSAGTCSPLPGPTTAINP